jgi:hypothetical protein
MKKNLLMKSFIVGRPAFQRIYKDDGIKDETGEAFGTHGRGDIFIQNFSRETLKRRELLRYRRI